jgi:serine protease Do
VILSVGPYIITGEKQNYISILNYMKSLKGGENIRFKVLRMGHELELEANIPNVKIKLL